MRQNLVKRACREGRVQVGSFITTNDPLCAQIMANSGFEWVLVDMEHGPVPITALQTAVTAIRTTATEPFVRAAWNASAAIQTALDSGVSGIMIPMINTRADAESAVRDKFSATSRSIKAWPSCPDSSCTREDSISF